MESGHQNVSLLWLEPEEEAEIESETEEDNLVEVVVLLVVARTLASP